MTANHRPLEEGDIELIDRVRATPCLYDTKDPNFRFVYKKEQEWQAIAEGLDMSHWEARKRWTVLRDRYARELKQLILHPDSSEYGKNDFFLRMDFIRNFVKKREAKRKRGSAHSGESIKTENPRPIKLYKVKCDFSSFVSDGNETSQNEKTYSSDYSQDLSSGKYSYVEQMSQGSPQQKEEQESGIDLEQQGDEEGYQDYVEDTSVAYETVEEHETLARNVEEDYMLTSSTGGRESTIIKPETPKLSNGFTISTVEEENEASLQQKPLTTSICTEGLTPNLPIDTEEYFSKTIALYLRQLSPRYKIKAKVQMMQIIEKYIDLEESKQ